jgi:hypothetical protein
VRKKNKKQTLSLAFLFQTNPSHQLRRAGHAHAHLAVVRELDAGVEGGLEREFLKN